MAPTTENQSPFTEARKSKIKVPITRIQRALLMAWGLPPALCVLTDLFSAPVERDSKTASFLVSSYTDTIHATALI